MGYLFDFMLISIIIPVLNEADQIGHLIDYLWTNGGGKIGEIIVADGGSTDTTCAIVEQKTAILLHCSPGRAIQMNAGARAAQYPILYFVHADTRPPVHYIQHIERALEAGHALGCFRYVFDSPNAIMRVNAWFTRFYFMFCQGGDKTLFVKKAVFEQLNGYDERFVVMEEYDFLRRAAQAGYPFYIMPANALVSARKYQHRSWLKVQWANFVVFNAWRWNLAQPQTLKTLYKRLLG